MFNMSFTDAQGVHHVDAVVVIQNAYSQHSQQINLTREPNGGYAEGNYSNRSASFSARYWPSQEAFDEGRPPYVLTDLAGNDNFSFQPAEGADLSTPAQLLAVLEAHLQSVILPSLVTP
jgi:hypothetical protein